MVWNYHTLRLADASGPPRGYEFTILDKFGNPKEMQIADLTKKGKTTKEISQILNLSVRTVDIHRFNIRRKLDITNKKINLQSLS